tara:strand:+ start:11683 stop:12963 length:1281 start_codon:yes stop_codon:yes gene_type:complete
MAINELIARGTTPVQIESPVNRLAKVLQIQGAQQNIARGEMEQDQYRQGVERKNKLISLMSGLPGDATDDQRSAALKGGGYFDEADKLDKGSLERRKIGSEADSKDIETEIKKVGQYRDMVASAKDPQQAALFMQIMHSDPHMAKTPIGKVPLEQALSQIGQDPESFNNWKNQFALGSAQFIEKNKPTYQTQNLGGTSQTLALPGLGGAPVVANSAPITQSADNAATQATSRSNNNDTVGATIRGQNMTDERARDLNKITQAGNASKPLNDTQSKAAGFGARMQDAHDTLTELAAGGTTTSNPGSSTGFGVGNVVTALSGADQQRLSQAKRDFVNAILRRESGAAISPTEFESAEKQYFPQIGDKPEVIAQKARNREIATRGVLTEVPEAQRDRVVAEIRGPKATPNASSVPTDIQALLAKHGGKK